jgi:predicted nucleic acid-binding protein
VNRLFLDANVLFTAAHTPRGRPAFLILLAAGNALRLFSSEYAVAEARRNLTIKHPEALDHFDAMLHAVRVVRQPPPPATDADAALAHSREQLPLKDQAILDAALGCRATHLLTGDIRHFGGLMNRPELVAGLLVQTVAGFLAAEADILPDPGSS